MKVHTDQRAAAINSQLTARAVTTGTDIFFQAGEYNPQSSRGRQLLAHELVHVVHQKGRIGASSPASRMLQRDSTPGATAAPAAAGAMDIVEAGLNSIRGEAVARSFTLGAYASNTLQLVDRARSRMVDFSEAYAVRTPPTPVSFARLPATLGTSSNGSIFSLASPSVSAWAFSPRPR